MKNLTLNKMMYGSKRFSSSASLKTGLFLCLIFTLTTNFSSGQTLGDYLLIAAENNPELKSHFTRYHASLEQVNQAGTLPDPEISMGVFIQKMETLMGNQKMDVSLMQMFPWFGMLKVQEEEAALMAKAQYESFREAKNNLFFQVKETYYQLFLLEEKLKITEENKKILETMERLALARFGSGSSSEAISPGSAPASRPSSTESVSVNAMAMGGGKQAAATPSMEQSSMGMGGGSSGKMTDVLRVQIQIKEIDNESVRLAEDKETLQTKFNLLLNREPGMDVVLSEHLEAPQLLLSQQALLDTVLQNNPMIKMLELDGEAAIKQGEMAKLEGRPMFGLGVNYMHYSKREPMGGLGGAHGGAIDYMPGGMGGNMVMPMISMTLPINRKKYKSMVRSSELMREAAVHRQKAMGNELALMLEEIVKELQTSDRNGKLYQEQEKLLRQTLDLMVTDYANANGSFEELLTVQQQLLDYRLKTLSNKVTRQIAFARLEALMGRG